MRLIQVISAIKFFCDDGSENMFVYQPIFDTLELKKDKGTDYVVSWKSKGVYTSKPKPLYTAFFHSIRISANKVEIKLTIDYWRFSNYVWWNYNYADSVSKNGSAYVMSTVLKTFYQWSYYYLQLLLFAINIQNIDHN